MSIKLDDGIELMTQANSAERERILRELEHNEEEATRKKPNIWKALEYMKKTGQWDGEIEEITPVTHNLKAGKHYYEIEDATKRTVVCTSCPIRHGLILEAHLLTRYTLEDGVLSLDGKPLNKV